MVYQPAEVVSVQINQQQHNLLNSANCGYKKEVALYQLNDNSMIKENSFHHNNGINHQQQIQQQHQRQMQPQQHLMQQSNPDLIKTNNVLLKNPQQPVPPFSSNLSPNSLSSINKNGPLLCPVHGRDFYNSPPPNYYNSTQQQPPFIHEKQIVNGNNGMPPNYFNINNDCNNLVSKPSSTNQLDGKQQIPNNSLLLSSIDTRLSDPSSLTNSMNNSINSNSTLNSTPSNKSQTNELNNNSLTVDSNRTKQKAETKTIFIVKIVDQVILNGCVVKETVIKNDEIVKQTGWIDWPETKQQNASTNSIHSSVTTANDARIAESKKNITPKSKNLKRVNSQSSQTKDKQQEKKAKTDDTKLKEEVKNAINDISAPPKVVETVKVDQTPPPSNKKASSSPKETLQQSLIKEQTQVVESNKDFKNLLNELNKKSDTINNPMSNHNNLTTTNTGDNIANDQTASVLTTTSLLNSNIDDLIFKPIDVKQKVLAKWNDKNFYPGTVISKENDSKWKIQFDDGGKRLVRMNEIICVEFLPRGQHAMVNYAAGFVSKGMIKSYREDQMNDQTYYMIEYVANGKCMETEYNARDVFLTGEGAQSLLNRRKSNINDSKFADVDLNNIIPKRSRISNKNMNETSNSSSLNSSTNDATKSSLPTPELDIIDNDSNSNLSSSTTNSSTTNGSMTKKSSKKGKTNTTTATAPNASIKREQQQNIPFNEDTESSTTNLNVSTNSLNLDFKSVDSTTNKEKIKDETLQIAVTPTTADVASNDCLFNYDNLIGPIPSSNIFKKFAFLLSFEDEKQNSEVAGYSIPFDIEHLTKQIKSGMGLILNEFEEIKDNYQVVLISHSYHQSLKYMVCLSTGIPCVKFTWIIDSCKQNQLLKKEDYILPSGFSKITNNLLQDRTIYKKSQTLFKGTKIYLVPSSTNSELKKWSPLFNASKAILLDSLPDTTRKSNSSDLVVSDSNCPKEIIEKASHLKILIVSINYIIECLIHGKRLGIDAHPTFHHAYSSSSK